MQAVLCDMFSVDLFWVVELVVRVCGGGGGGGYTHTSGQPKSSTQQTHTAHPTLHQRLSVYRPLLVVW